MTVNHKIPKVKKLLNKSPKNIKIKYMRLMSRKNKKVKKFNPN
jgi:hypothetical protein